MQNGSVTDGLPVLPVVKAAGLVAEGHLVQVIIQVYHLSIRILNTCCQINIRTTDVFLTLIFLCFKSRRLMDLHGLSQFNQQWK